MTFLAFSPLTITPIILVLVSGPSHVITPHYGKSDFCITGAKSWYTLPVSIIQSSPYVSIFTRMATIFFI